MFFTHETARTTKKTALDALRARYADRLIGDCDATFLRIDRDDILGAVGLAYEAPLCANLLNEPTVSRYLAAQNGDTVLSFGARVRRLTADGETDLPADVAEAAESVYRRVLAAAGTLNERGEHVIDLKSDKIGTHYDVNLLIGNRIGFRDPLLTTPKGALDSLGRGSFRGTAARQVTSTRYNLIPEQNGEPANRQFYLVENGAQIFYSADVHTNVKTAVCRHGNNVTVITYETECGLRITRTLFILPQENGMPEAVEAQRVEIENLTGADRELKIVFTGMFGLATPESVLNDTVYASVTWESGLLCREGVPVAIAPSPFPQYLKPLKRFAAVIADGGFLEEYAASYLDFIGNGTLEHPQNIAHLSCAPVMKIVPFFAMAKTLRAPAHGKTLADSFVGMSIVQGGKEEVADAALFRLLETYQNPQATADALARVTSFADRYAGFLSVTSDDPTYDAYVNHNLPFQVYYQSYVSRSFAWTQKANREIGFREIQDMFASLYYITGMGEYTLAKEMLGCWISNVYEMGYANHNFYYSGKEPGKCSDDGLWLSQAIARYVSLTGDTAFLDAEFPIAGSDRKRTVLDTLLAIVMYSGKISVGAHGMPLLDKADWNDCLKLDDDWIDGPEKEKCYLAQLAESGKPYGTALENEYSESVMNAFLLKVAYDDIRALAAQSGRTALAEEMAHESAALTERIRTHAWKGDFYARALVGGKRDGGYTFLGAGKDGLSLDPTIDGTYFLNSFSWSILAGVADEEQIGTMLVPIRKYLVTPAGIKLCTPCNLGALASGTASASYFPGDRENGGVFKHAAMMAAAACLKAAKTVSSDALAEELTALAAFATETVYPYKTLEHPYHTKGNPRFCTQYNNSTTGENIGPMLSGTASWLSLTVLEQLGVTFDGDEIRFSPILPSETTAIRYTIRTGDAVLHVGVKKPRGFARVSKSSRFAMDGAPFDGTIRRPKDGEHQIEIEV